ncbi:MAG: hypothetical protein U5R49_03670 [Deltaproteobacteria bacterium]|nr:hypothetical protein [Deltaproteobacteria bacterium]
MGRILLIWQAREMGRGRNAGEALQDLLKKYEKGGSEEDSE